MRHDLEVKRSVLIDASIDTVWEGLTNPVIIKEYLYGTETLTDWQPGSSIVFQGEYEGQTYRDHGIIEECVSNSKIAYSYWSSFSGLEDIPENHSKVTYELKKLGEKSTELTWIQTGFADEERQKHSAEGMDSFLQSIKAVIEKI